MKKNKISLVDKRLLRTLLLLALIQIIIIILFVESMSDLQKIDIQDTVEVDITVDDIYIHGTQKTERLYVVADDTKYVFKSRSSFNEYSTMELSRSVSIGDQLSLRYFKSDKIFFPESNIVVGAESENEIYRTIEEYNNSKNGLAFWVILIFSVIELIFVPLVTLFVWLNFKKIKNIYKTLSRKTVQSPHHTN